MEVHSFDPATQQRSIYLDYHASTPLDPEVFEAMRPWFLEDYGNPHSSEHAFGWRAQHAVETARARIAELIGTDANHVIFTSGATESNNLAILGVAATGHEGRDTILVSAIEHASVLEPARRLAERGFRLIELPVDRNGVLSLDALDAALDSRVLLVSVGVVNNEIGVRQDLAAIGERCKNVGALLHTDAAQALTGMELPLGSLPVDFASLASHKSYGPKGIGALYVAPHAARSLSPLLLGGGHQWGLRAGTAPTPLCVGFGHACAKLQSVGRVERAFVAQQRDSLHRRLIAAISGTAVNGPVIERHPGSLNLRIPGIDARDLVHLVQPQLACSTGSACHSGFEGPSHVLQALGLNTRDARASLRIGIGRFTTADELTEASAMLADAVVALRARESAVEVLPKSA